MNEHFTIDFADAVVIKERVGNIKIGNVLTGNSSSVTLRQDSDGMLVLDFTLEKGEKGYTPQKSIDYWTQVDKTQMVRDVLNSLSTWEGGSY